jgi:pimaricinolide synthase PimS1
VTSAPETLIDLLDQRAESSTGKYHFLKDGRDVTATTGYAPLRNHAQAVANRLRQHVAEGSRALLLYPPGLDVLPAFFGCLNAGIVAVPVPPPDGVRLKHSLPRLQGIVADAEAEVILTTAGLQQDLEARLSETMPQVHWIATDVLEPTDAPDFERPDITPESLAYLQYTSGSTSAPRGVMLSHGNVLANLVYLQQGFACDADSVCVTWMPYFHDYGLVEGLLQPMFSGADCYVLSPLTLLKRPIRWLEAMDRFGGTHTHAPNFAYELCLERITVEQRETLDLSRWRVAGNGAEPVRAENLRRFTEAFGQQGFRAETFYPAYGMAEATLFVTARAHDQSPHASRLSAEALEQNRVVPADATTPKSTTRTVASCGVPRPGTDLRIVDPATERTCAPDTVGELWISSPSVGLGYWRRPEETEATFRAHLTDSPDAGPFLRTGDLGFLKDGELHITGRLKDLIVVAGVNHYPQDIEWTVLESCPDLRREHCAAFSVERDAEERLIILAEAGKRTKDWEEAFGIIRQAVARSHGLATAEILILERGQIRKTSSGKVQRRACRQAYLDNELKCVARWSREHASSARTDRPTAPKLRDWLSHEIGRMLSLAPEAIDQQAPFAELGLDSRSAVALVAALEDHLGGATLDPTLLWQHPTIAALSDLLTGAEAKPAHAPAGSAASPTSEKASAIAIIGLACRLPGAPDAQAYWDLLKSGTCAVRADGRLPGVEAGFLEDVDSFDASFFGLSESEARSMDPQQRILLEVAWHALEHAGVPADRLEGTKAGVFVGISSADFAFDQFSRSDAEGLMNAYSGTGVAFSIAANRLSYHLDLRGPSMAIDTACSSSLVAVHQACQSLRSGECDVALAGGVNIIGGPHLQLALERAGMLSPNWRSRTFAFDADGYVRGEGCGMVVLKPLAAAERDGDRVLAVIRGSAVNQDGRSNGLTAPNPLAQQSVIRDALKASGLEAADIDFVETHGTGTRLGDPIEVGALQSVLGQARPSERPCLLGSAKANIGHLEAAAGIAGLVKTVLCLRHGEVPAQPNLDTINPLIKLDNSALEIPRVSTRLPKSARAAVSSFGFGGTNAHVVLEQAPDRARPEREQAALPPYLLTLSARDPHALSDLAGRYAALCSEEVPAIEAEQLCRAAAIHRPHLDHRLAVIGNSPRDFAERLEAIAAGEGVLHRMPVNPPSVAFLFTGQGSQYLDMGRSLYERHAGFRATLDRCDQVFADLLDRSVLSVMFGKDADLLEQTAYTQPALFALEYALAKLWHDWGIRPAALLGHSVGEYVAACIAGVFDLETGLRLIAERARLIQSLPLDGAMLAVMAAEAQLAEFAAPHADNISIAAVNGPRNTVLSGRRKTLARVQEKLESAGLRSRFLSVSHAFHSPLIDPVLERFRKTASRFDFAAPAIPLVSNLDGKVLEMAPDADYWARHMRGAVRFADGMESLAADHRAFLEIGPKPLLTALGAQCVDAPDALWLPSLRNGAEDWTSITESLSALYTVGITPDWAAFHGSSDGPAMPDLPSYPFRRQSFPMPARPEHGDAAAPVRAALASRLAEPAHAGAITAVPIEEWGFVPRWKQVSAAPREDRDTSEWLLLADKSGTAKALAKTLKKAGDSVTVITGPAPDSLPGGAGPLNIMCLWPLDLNAPDRMTDAEVSGAISALTIRLTGLVQNLAAQADRPLKLHLVSRQAFAMADTALPKAGKGLLQSFVWGLGRSLRHEHPDWNLSLIDVDGSSREAASQLLAEISAAQPGNETLWRQEKGTPVRFELTLEAAPLPLSEKAPERDGTWLVTGGLGGLGQHMAERLVERGVRHLALVSRNAPKGATAERIEEWRARGVEIQIGAIDVTDAPALSAFVDALPAHWPPLTGILHAAGVLDDAVLHQQSAERVLTVMAPKVMGGWALHRLAANHPIRHFMLVSSASGLLGNPGQTAYGAANSMLDALALYRRRRGLPAQSICWSAWADASRDAALADRLARHGLAPIETVQGLEAMDRATALDLPHVAILPRRSSARLVHPLLDGSPIQPDDGDTANTAPDSRLTTQLRMLAPEERLDRLTAYILEQIGEVATAGTEAPDADRGFFDQGLDSMNAIELRNRLQTGLGGVLPATLAFDYPTPKRLAQHLMERAGLDSAARTIPAMVQNTDTETRDGIAILSLGCRIPGGVNDPEAFWTLLKDGVDAITEIPGNRWDVDRYYSADPEVPGTIQTRHGGFIDNIDLFDPGFFGISPREATHLDPQQRLLLEVCWEVLERAGIPPSSLEGSQTGVFVGISTNDYLHRLNRTPDRIDAYLGTGNALSVAANRLSFFLGLEGPSLAIDTACSSSLVALHQACMSLRSGESDLAIGGGVNLLLDPTVSINHSRARMLAPDGRCKAFAAEADGFVRSEGCGLVLLKRLSDAVRDGDRIMAVIRGSAVNQDGRTSGLTVPNGPAQERVIRRALNQADLVPEQIDYVEAHGTGTALGDPIEAGALDAVFGTKDRSHPLTIGSVKSNIGHLESAAGVAGLQKIVLSLNHGAVPPSLHSTNRNPNIDWARIGLHLPEGTEPWPASGTVRRAGVSSFGFGGTNAHLIVEQAPEPEPRQVPEFSRYLLPLSAKSRPALRLLAQSVLETLKENPVPLADLCFTAACGRDHFPHRLALLGSDKPALIAALENWLEGRDDEGAIARDEAVTRQRSTAEKISAGQASSGTWRVLAGRYADGENPDWSALYSGLPLRLADLPGHPFERQRYWVEAESERRSAAPNTYKVNWEPVAPDTEEPAPPRGNWLILADESGVGQAVANELEARGGDNVLCTLIFKAPLNGHRRNLVPGDEAAARALLDELGPLEGIVHLWSLDGPDSGELTPVSLTDATGGLASLLPLTRGMLDLPHPPRLWLLTQGAVDAHPDDRLDGLAHAPIWGFGRSIALEEPHIWGGLVDLPPTPDISRIADALTAAGSESELALRDGQFLVPRLHPAEMSLQQAVSIKSDASYLISGGFGSLGCAIGLWLARQGAGRILLTSRQGAQSAAAQEHVKALEDLGAAVETAALDVSDAEALTAQIGKWGQNGPPLRGVIHTAGIGEMRNLGDLIWPDCAAVLAGKAGGAWALHTATAGEELDFFFGCGSIAGLWGGQKQASYAAANAFLDGLAAFRRGRGLCGASLDLGPLSGTGMVSEETGRELRRMGLEPFPTDHLLDRLPELLNPVEARTALVAADWPRFAELYRSQRPTGLFDPVLADRGPSTAPAAAPRDIPQTRKQPQQSPLDWLAATMSSVLHLPPDRLAPDTPLPMLGLDSLLAMEVRTLIERELGLTIGLPDLLGSHSLNDLAERLSRDLPAGTASPEPDNAWIAGQI